MPPRAAAPTYANRPAGVYRHGAISVLGPGVDRADLEAPRLAERRPPPTVTTRSAGSKRHETTTPPLGSAASASGKGADRQVVEAPRLRARHVDDGEPVRRGQRDVQKAAARVDRQRARAGVPVGVHLPVAELRRQTGTWRALPSAAPRRRRRRPPPALPAPTIASVPRMVLVRRPGTASAIGPAGTAARRIDVPRSADHSHAS